MSKSTDYLLVSDLDNTLLGDDAALERFRTWYGGDHPSMDIVYCSGRFFPSIKNLVETGVLPTPRAVIGAVGTNIHAFPSGETMREWHEHIGSRWDARTVRRLMDDQPGFELQPDEFQSPYKVSYYFHDATEDDLRSFARKIEESGLAAQIIYSSSQDLDFLPERADKGKAATFLTRRWGYDSGEVIVSGDSGNDLALFRHGFRGIIVANAKQELKGVTGDSIYHADSPYAAGVLEGIHFWLERAETDASG